MGQSVFQKQSRRQQQTSQGADAGAAGEEALKLVSHWRRQVKKNSAPNPQSGKKPQIARSNSYEVTCFSHPEVLWVATWAQWGLPGVCLLSAKKTLLYSFSPGNITSLSLVSGRSYTGCCCLCSLVLEGWVSVQYLLLNHLYLMVDTCLSFGQTVGATSASLAPIEIQIWAWNIAVMQ